MHPVIRIASFVLLSVLLARAQPMQMGWLGLVILTLYIIYRGKGIASASRLLWRLRWLFLSIVLLYLWMPLGALEESILLAAQRITLLVMMVLALQVLVINLEREAIISALYRLLSPLQNIGIACDRFVLRLLLTFDCVKQLPLLLSVEKAKGTRRGFQLRYIANRLFNTLVRVIDEAENATHDPVSIDTAMKAPLWQWLYPLGVLFVYVMLS